MVTLLKSVLSSLSIFLLSFYKAHVNILRDIEKIQQRFLWGDKEDRRWIHWFGWNQVCKSNKLGGLEVKIIKEFNLALLYK